LHVGVSDHQRRWVKAHCQWDTTVTGNKMIEQKII
jgi:hypothetical protein